MKASLKLFVLLLVALLVATGCSSNDNSKDTAQDEDEATTETDEQGDSSEDGESDESDAEGENSEKEGGSLEADEEGATDIEEHENVESAMIQLESFDGNDFVNADITLSAEVNGEEAAQEFYDILKEKYPDRVIDIILIYEDDVLHQETFE